MLNWLLLGQKWVKILISTQAHTYIILDNPPKRYTIYLQHKWLFVLNFWCFSEDTVFKLKRKVVSFLKFS